MSNEIKNRTVYMLCRADKTEDDGNYVYVGSTSQPLCQRLRTHTHRAGNPSQYYGGSKLYERMREIRVQKCEIVPLLTFACTRAQICEFERGNG